MLKFKNSGHRSEDNCCANKINLSKQIGLAAKAIVMLIFAVANAFPTGLAIAEDKPNIILINLDDADCEMFELSYSDILYPNMMAALVQTVFHRSSTSAIADLFRQH